MNLKNNNLLKNQQRRQFLVKLSKYSGLAALSALPLGTPLAAQNNRINGVRIAANSAITRLVLDLNGPVKHNIFTLNNPARVVIDIQQVSLLRPLPSLKNKANGLIHNLRSAPRGKGDLRVVLDLTHMANPKSILLKPSKGKGYRLVIDLKDGRVDFAENKKRPVKPKQFRDVIVAIDAGHGGKDPGAVGRRGTKEKDVVLSVAKKLERLIQKEKGVKAVMIRSRDEYISLRGRIKKAREQNADLFISIHADAYRRRSASGSSVFTLSNKGATSEAAKWLANKENSAELFGDISIKHHDKAVASLILELAQTSTIESSLDIGKDILVNLKRIGKVHRGRVEQANFAVLKSPDIPSVLIETAFLSNPNEEKKLRTRAYQQKLANAMLKGVNDYFKQNAPPDSILANLNKQTYG